ncbi:MULTISPECIES: 4-alpha-glucanotransferase [Proteiniphilum]|jgi:4-alpha-glucanotransferase|uniref:4-alpha-glucanotransferase n=1 Tax=Proteiniphilum TaxID=294702 RepID=UPI001EEA329C|nr:MULTISPECIES: 4-alpha-glucanotransferase [Proteiniphilum]ULB33894.1 4-alpha-glucanotransferase [Proteiniphilum propionicum]
MVLLTFQIDYHTTWGQSVCLCGSIPELGNYNETDAVVLSNDGDRWYTEINVSETAELQYYYFIRQGNSTIRREWGSNRRLNVIEKIKEYLVQDLWKNRPYHTYLYSSAFTESIFFHEKEPLPSEYYSQTVLLNVTCPYVCRDQILSVSGDCEALGGWDLKKAKTLSLVNDGEWQIVLDAEELPETCYYKFVILDKKSGKAIHWEDGGNRILYAGKAHKNYRLFAEMALQYHHHHFSYKGVGTSIPVFSLRTNESFGVGDFTDLHKMIDWAVATRQQLIQLLPVNDTTSTGTWCDSYPYSGISIYALHPIYLGCMEYPLKDKKKLKDYREEAEHLNCLPKLDYEKVLKLKRRYSRDLFVQDGREVLSSEEYIVFYEKNKAWIFPYACYCLLRDKNSTADFRNWGEFSSYDEARLKRMLEVYPEAKNETNYWFFVQFLLHKQFSRVKKYAHSRGVTLKGDIPIGISRNSIDAWTNPNLFNMDTQSGAPPDDFSFFGQNWGFPTYNWYAMEEDGYAWWISRFQKMADYFDAYRIDHILGFFRIWEIPLDAVQGLLGHFNPALPYWAEEINRAGIPFDEERMVKPFIHEHFLPDIFDKYTKEVKENYLEVSGWQRFKLKPFCDSQKKIKHLFDSKSDKKSRLICDGLLSLCTEVLFIRDPLDQNRFHPRITAQYTYSYKYLDDNVKEAFNRLYVEFFYNRHNYFWREQAMKKLPVLISSTPMMVCGEDLGMVPDCVPSVMHELQMLSLEIERMPKDQHATFTDLQKLPYLSVCTTSTHDMSPLRLWWTENRELTQRYYNEVLHREGTAPAECNTAICLQIIEHHLQSSAMWVILPLQDWMSIDERLRNPDIADERINVPANPSHYWRYRMHISLDDLLKETTFNKKVEAISRR